MGTLRVSAGEFVMRASRAWWVLIIGGVAAIIGVYNDFTGKTAPQWIWYGVGLISIYVSAFVAFHALRIERDELRDRLNPRFALVFDQNNKWCLQESTWSDADGALVIARLYRLGLRNPSGVSINHMRVWIKEIAPMPPNFAPVYLRRMGEHPGLLGYSYDGFTLNPSPPDGTPSVYIEVAGKRSAGNASDHIEIHRATQGALERVTPGDYVLTIVAEGEDSPTVEGRFALTVGEDGVLYFVEATSR